MVNAEAKDTRKYCAENQNCLRLFILKTISSNLLFLHSQLFFFKHFTFFFHAENNVFRFVQRVFHSKTQDEYNPSSEIKAVL